MSGAGRAASWRMTLAAVLGLAWRPALAPARPSWRRAQTSGYEEGADAVNPLQFGRAYQLPPFGRGNSLEALFWAPLARVPAERADPLLSALAAAGIAAWAAPVRRTAHGLEDLWVAAAESERAQDVLLQVLSAHRRIAGGGTTIDG